MGKNVRACVLNCLDKIINDKAYSNIVLQNDLDGLSSADKRLATTIIYGTLQNYRLLRYQWAHMVKKMPGKRIGILIDMSVYQLLMMDKIPSYAIVNEANLLAGKYKSFVNAILHNVMDQGLVYGSDDVNLSVEKWLYEMFLAHYGKDKANSILKSYLDKAILYGRINSLVCTKDDFKDQKFIDDKMFIVTNDLLNSEMFKKGMFVIQDKGGSKIIDSLDLKEGLQVLDLCSAPGTKACQMAMIMNDKGHIDAFDLYESRLSLIKENTRKLNIHIIDTKVNDASIEVQELFDKYDRILVDAPCSGLGVLRRKPDIKLNIQPEDLDNIITLQKQILNNAAKYLKVNGIMVYSTCTLNKKENERQIQSFLAERPDYSLVSQRTIFPFEFDSDGFFVAKLWRNGL